MKKFYLLKFTIIFCLAFGSMQAQRVVDIPASTDLANPTDIFPYIAGDTTATGDRNDMNTIYTLENGSVYITTGQITNDGWPLHIQAKDLANTDSKAILTRIPNASGSYPNILRAFGDVTFKNLWIVQGEKGPGEQHDWGKIRIMGDNHRVIVDNCIMEKDRGGLMQMRGNGTKLYITNSILRNGGNRYIIQGNGRAVDARDTWMDTLVVRNTVMHNFVDRIFRSQGGSVPHNYIEFDRNTIFNQGGRHGTFQFGKVLTVKITNNVIENPNMQGTTPAYTDEQTQVDNSTHKVFTVDTLYPGTNFTFASNNIYWTQDVLDFYGTIDTVQQVGIFSDQIVERMGNDGSGTYISEVLNLASVPSRTTFLQYYRDLYANPAADNMQDIIVQDALVAGTARDFGYLFDFSSFSPCYPTDAQSATADVHGGAIGAVYFCDDLNEGVPVVEPARYVLIEASGDPANPKDIFEEIVGDTTATGERVNIKTIYQLQNGEVYITTGQITNDGWPLTIEAVDLNNTALKPVLTRIPNASGSYPNILRAFGDFTLRNVWVVQGEKGPGEQHDWGKIRIMGDNLRVIVDNCIMEKDRGGLMQMRGNGTKLYITNTILRNGGNRFIIQGNGRAVDARDTWMDTLVVRNTVMHNFVDRIFRSQGGSVPHNYIEFDHNTIFNQGGRHGTFQFGKALTVKVTNNVIENPNMQGTTPVLTDEQTQVDNESHKVFTVDTLYPGTNFTFASNNIYWTQDVLDFYGTIDTVQQVTVFSQQIMDRMGNDGSGTYFSEVLELGSVPSRETFLQYYKDLYANPAADNMQDIIVQDALLAGSARDFGYLFDFSSFDPCYPGNTQSAGASTTGGFIGAVSFCPQYVNTFSPVDNDKLELSVRPNPFSYEAFISYNLTERGPVRMTLHNIMGQEVALIVNSERSKGEHTVSFTDLKSVSQGIYIIRLETQEGSKSMKVMITK